VFGLMRAQWPFSLPTADDKPLNVLYALRHKARFAPLAQRTDLI
jgi:hypothetical protein